MEVEVIDTLSDIRSLTGVPGRWVDDKLPRREGTFAGVAVVESFEPEAVDVLCGVPCLDVGRTRIVRAWPLFPTFAPEACEIAVTGVSG